MFLGLSSILNNSKDDCFRNTGAAIEADRLKELEISFGDDGGEVSTVSLLELLLVFPELASDEPLVLDPYVPLTELETLDFS